MDEIYTILEVANLLSVTTQAVYKRLQQDQETLDPFVTSKGGKKSLTKEGVLKLAELMGLDEPFSENAEKEPEAEQTSENTAEISAQAELLKYLREENERLKLEVDSLKREITDVRQLRESDLRSAEEERRTYQEERLRADTLLMRAIMNQQRPRLLDRIFKKKNKPEESDNFGA